MTKKADKQSPRSWPRIERTIPPMTPSLSRIERQIPKVRGAADFRGNSILASFASWKINSLAIVSERDWPCHASKAFALEVILGVGIKTLSNYTNHIAQTPLDRSASWSKVA